MKLKRCKKEICWEYCTDCNGSRDILVLEKSDENLSGSDKLKLYMSLMEEKK